MRRVTAIMKQAKFDHRVLELKLFMVCADFRYLIDDPETGLIISSFSCFLHVLCFRPFLYFRSSRLMPDYCHLQQWPASQESTPIPSSRHAHLCLPVEIPSILHSDVSNPTENGNAQIEQWISATVQPPTFVVQILFRNH